MVNIKEYMAGIIPSNEENNESPVCSGCGRCCKNMACHISPDDVKDKSVEGLIKWIESSGAVSIDWWVGDTEENDYYDRVYYLRMKHHNENFVCGSYGGKCVFLTPTGCSLSFEYRGKGARGLAPAITPGEDECIETFKELNGEKAAIEYAKWL